MLTRYGLLRDHARGNESLLKEIPGLRVYGGDDRIGGLTDKVTNAQELKVHTKWQEERISTWFDHIAAEPVLCLVSSLTPSMWGACSLSVTPLVTCATLFGRMHGRPCSVHRSVTRVPAHTCTDGFTLSNYRCKTLMSSTINSVCPLLWSTGDTLFIGGCGWFLEGTAEQMYHNLTQVLGSLPQDTVSRNTVTLWH